MIERSKSGEICEMPPSLEEVWCGVHAMLETGQNYDGAPVVPH